MKKNISSPCDTPICQVADYSFLQSMKIRKEMRTFLEKEAGTPVTLQSLSNEAEKFLSREPNGNSYGSLDFGLVLKLLYVCGGRLMIGSNSEYRQCRLRGGADLCMKEVELFENDFDQILARLRTRIEMERSTDCNALRKDHLCKPIYQLINLKDIQKLRRSSGIEPTFDEARTILGMFCYELSLSLKRDEKVRQRLVAPGHQRQAG